MQGELVGRRSIEVEGGAPGGVRTVGQEPDVQETKVGAIYESE